MELTTIIEAAKAYRDLGGAVQEQLDDLIEAAGEGRLPDDINLNALEMIEDFLTDLPGLTAAPMSRPAIDADELAEVLATAAAYRTGPEEQAC